MPSLLHADSSSQSLPAINGNGINGHHEPVTNGHIESAANGSTTNGHHEPAMNGNGISGHHEPAANGNSINDINGHHDAVNSTMNRDFVPAGAGSDSTAIAEPVAIVGMGMRLPGGIRNASSYWELLYNKRSARTRVPANRYNVDAFHGPASKPGCVGTTHGYFLEDVDPADLDVSFWSMTKQEAEVMDPQQRLALEVVYECLENAGITNWRGETIGCYAGCFGEDWLDMELKDDQENANMYRMTGYSDFALANRVSYEFGFQGPSMTIRTACSASLTGVHEACVALARGDCTAAVVCGTNVITAPRMTIALTEQGVISPTGSCKTFSADADGYARAEGASAIYLKKLSDALRDGDPIRAVIRGTAVNSDGKTPGLTMPRTDTHEALIRRAYRVAGIDDYSQTAMIECHGTGTRAGDPIEAKAVARVFGGHGVYIGSVKPNLGHSEGNSGLSSVIKMVLALENKTIPPNINFTSPNPDIPFEEAKLVVPTEPMPWPREKCERVGVNSFGIGGANAHVILESAPHFEGNGIGSDSGGSSVGGDLDTNNQPKLLVFSAKHPDALHQMASDYEAYAMEKPQELGNMSYTLGTKREVLSHRAFAVVSSPSAHFELSNVSKRATPSQLVFTFTGQGAQWAQMGKELFESQPVFRDSVRALDAVLAALDNPPPWTMEEAILLPKSKSRLSEGEFSQPCCTAIGIGLVDVLKSINVHPAAVTGHSSGEIAAAYACGAITAKEGILIAYHKGQVAKGVGHMVTGGMAAIGLGRTEVTPFLLPGVLIGCENSPASVTLTGNTDVLETVMESIRTEFPDVLVRALRVECAYHSHHMEAVADRYLNLIKDVVDAKAPKVPFYSSVTGKVITTAGELGAPYWIKNLVSPVLFLTAVKNVLTGVPSPKTFLELGPHSALAGPIRQTLKTLSSSGSSSKVDYVATLVRGNNAVADLLHTAGQVWLRNTDVNFSRLMPHGTFLSDLPSYPWHYEGKYWAESRLSKEWRLRKFPYHDILGTRVAQSTDLDPSWRNILRLGSGSIAWLRDHEIAGDVLFPGAGFIAMAGESIRQLAGSSDYTVRRLSIITALVVQEGNAVEVVTNLRPARLTKSLDSNWWDFTISSLHGSTWTKHVSGQIRAGTEFRLPASDITPLPRQVSSQAWYGIMRRFGLNYGPRFRPLKDITAGVTDTTAVASLEKDEGLEAGESPYALHPATLDATFQALMVAAFQGVTRAFDKLAVPTYIEELYIKPPRSTTVTTKADAVSSPSGLRGNLVGVSDGETVIRLSGAHLSPIGAGNGDVDGGEDPHAGVELRWERDINFLDIAMLLPAVKEDRAVMLDKSLLQGQDGVAQVHDLMRVSEYGDFFSLLGHYKPNMKILEIGAGAGGMTATILPHLTSPYGERLYGSYTYTDVSAAGFDAAKERFKNVQAMDYVVLDIAQDPVEQGLELESFDLVVASNALRAATSIDTSLQNIQKLLHPRGRLFLQELSPTSKWVLDVQAASTLQKSCLSVEQWDAKLRASGFGGLDAVKFDGQLNNHMVAMPSCDKHPQTKRITILDSVTSGNRTANVHISAVEAQFRAKGYQVDLCSLDQVPPPDQTIISLLDLEAPFLHNVTAPQFEAFKTFLNHIKNAGIIWITGAGQVNSRDPRYSMILGLARTVRSETGIDFATLELEAFNASVWNVLPSVLHQYEHRVHDKNGMKPVLEYAYANGAVQVGKFHWISVADELIEPKEESRPKQLDVGRPGALQTLYWKQAQPLPALAGDWVEVEPRAVGLNFKDVLIAMNIVPGPARDGGEGGLGLECAGLVTKVGPDVKDLKVGDRVVSMAPGSFATTLTCSEKLCAKMPDNMDFVDGSTIPCVFGTVIYSLMDLARLEKGQTVLIHSACGGVGLAALQIARMVGADIFCTVGSPEKVEFLTANLGIPRNRIFNSRDASFLPAVLAETDGRGIDVVLNSLSGELLHASWQCVAEFGVMVEIGKRDFIGQAALSMDLFEQNRSFMGVDLSHICKHRPVLMNSLLRRTVDFFAQGHIKSVGPVKTFEAPRVEEAFRYMQKGQHIGKIAVTMREVTEQHLQVAAGRKHLTLRPDRAYLLIGGLGGLGRSVASWFVERGARHLIFLSRSAGSISKDDPYFVELEAQGCTVQAFSGDVIKADDVARVVKEAAKPIAGVLQATMVLNDVALHEMTFDQWSGTTQPKVQGTWNLHKALLAQEEPLDFFFLFSSLHGIAGQINQANYAAANTFLDAFVQFRQAQGLPAAVLDVGVMGDVGYLSHNTNVLDALRSTAMHILREQDLLDALQLMIERSATKQPRGAAALRRSFGFVNRAQVGIGFRSRLPLSAPNNRTIWKRDPRMAVYRNRETAGDETDAAAATTSDGRLKKFLRDVAADPAALASPESAAFLAREIGTTLAGFMISGGGEDMDLNTPLGTMGVDSLISIELRNWFRQKVTAEFTVWEIVGSQGLLDLGAKTAAKLAEKSASKQ